MCAFVAAHAGCGTHPHKTENVCLKAVCKSKGGIVEAVKELENDFRTNCGFGSNLTYNGHVECEAAFTSSEDHVFGAVGAVSRLRNPIEVAAMVAKEQLCGDKKFVLPTVLVGQGAEDWAQKRGIELCDPASLISKRSQQQWREAREICRNWGNDMMDTVGAVSYENGGCNAACSSGGIILKAEGRLGHTIQIGGAIWADERDSKSTAIALSGCGEYIAQTLLAKTLSESLLSWNCEEDVILDKIKHVFNAAFMHSPYLQSRNEKHILAGGLVLFIDKEAGLQGTLIDENSLRYSDSGCAELVSFHNTAEMTFAFLVMEPE
ncbi:Threonine aspartase 1 [Dirofilaria immitis]|nr:Threonine aspartase 1 [Dirofilaria immitis]